MMHTRILLHSLLFILATAFAYAQQPEIFSTEAGAIQGYDPVAFFKESKPVMGKKEFSFSWNEASWYFSSEENLNLFKADPAAYAPQYGGWCAYGTAAGHKSPTEPDTWSIVNNKLYFNYNSAVKKLWNKNQKGLIDQADKNWPRLKKE
jgi:YHS domain-containing protein